MRNELYEPYKIGADWYFDCRAGRRGPFVSEQRCVEAAASRQEAEEMA
jgi:hypothetical protein